MLDLTCHRGRQISLFVLGSFYFLSIVLKREVGRLPDTSRGGTDILDKQKAGADSLFAKRELRDGFLAGHWFTGGKSCGLGGRIDRV